MISKKQQQEVQELKAANRKLLAENVDLKMQLEELKQRITALECVAQLIEGSRK